MKTGSLFVALARHLDAESDPCTHDEGDASEPWPQGCDVAKVLVSRIGDFVEEYRQTDRALAEQTSRAENFKAAMTQLENALDMAARAEQTGRTEIDRVRVEAHGYQKERDDAIDILSRISGASGYQALRAEKLPANLKDRLKEWGLIGS